MAERIQVVAAGELFDVAKPDQVNTLSEAARRTIVAETALSIAVFSLLDEFAPILAPVEPEVVNSRVQNLRRGLSAFGVDAEAEILKARHRLLAMTPQEQAALAVGHMSVPTLS